ncbi:glycosyltransferase, group 1 family protein [Oesophagostomum dentatum]|uniref:Alpha-1,3/1,6-mannosyltransferase ALG2 n=1 Tax=Oesophagostomum dentatum TaxID=61180 RepID=A0A0B1TVQ7_OESDE|nr:glycosyltransferase, group 1 family protein [Oesophagostomum dentatum]
MHVVIIHPEQWNGGSDRCTVALIRHFVSKGYKVTWLTTMIDEYWKDHKFEGVDIREVGLKLHPGDWWSQNVALGWYLVFNNIKPDLVVVDHSARWYSNLIGLIEEQLFEKTDVIMVNSHFTASQFSRVMPHIEKSKIRVVYPPCDVDSIVISAEKPMSRRDRPQNDVYIFMSMNRFWPEKRLDIIVEAASLLKKRGYKFLVQLAGSVMPHIPESRIYYELLQKMTRDLYVTDVVHFIPSPSECQKFELYRQCDSALYTPPNEHFGIVPIEALDQRRPVIVCDSGGPAETVIEDVTGSKILKPTGELLAEAMMHHIKKQDWPALDCDETYEKQRARFDRDFSLRGFCAHIDEAVAQLFPDLAAISSRNRRALA